MMTTPVRSRRWPAFAALHLFASALLLYWIGSQLVPVDLPRAAGERLRCVSYSPFYRPGTSPLDPRAHVTPGQIRSDLEALKSMTGCVRIYAVNQGLDAVPAIAAELHMQVLLGAWVGADAVENARQLEHAIELANRYPGTVRALMVGNEVLLRREQPVAELARLLREARARSEVPVSYADVWEFWLRNAQLADDVDFVTVHILPFWEDQPIAVEHAVDHVDAIRQRVSARFDKPVLIGETGWPSAGRQREAAAPGRVAQARFVRELLVRANREGWDYNLIEALDQPWKRWLEGTVGGYWGVLDVDLRPRFSLDDPVSERSGWGRLPLFGALGALLLAGVAAWARRERMAVLAWAAAGLWAGLVAALLVEHAQLAWRDWRELAVLGAASLLGPAWLLASAAGPDRAAARALRIALLFCVAVGALWLAVDPRYRDFPLWMYAGAAPALWLTRDGNAMPAGALRVLLPVIGVAALARWLPEPGNPQAVAWLLLCLVLAAGGGASREQQQGQ